MRFLIPKILLCLVYRFHKNTAQLHKVHTECPCQSLRISAQYKVCHYCLCCGLRNEVSLWTGCLIGPIIFFSTPPPFSFANAVLCLLMEWYFAPPLLPTIAGGSVPSPCVGVSLDVQPLWKTCLRFLHSWIEYAFLKLNVKAHFHVTLIGIILWYKYPVSFSGFRNPL